MTKSLVKYLLLFSFLLLALVSQTGKVSPYDQSSERVLGFSNSIDAISLESSQSEFFFRDASTTNSQRGRTPIEFSVVEVEESEDKLDAHKRSVVSNIDLSIICLALILASFQKYLAKRLPSKRQLIHFTSFKWFILFRVFRI